MTKAEFAAAVKREHGQSAYGREYAAAIEMIRAHTAIWAPRKRKSK